MCQTKNKKISSLLILSSSSFIYVTCVVAGVEGVIRVRIGTKRLVGTGHLILSMGLVWREVHILAQRATTSNRIFLILLPHMCHCSVFMGYNMLLVLFFFSSTG